MAEQEQQQAMAETAQEPETAPMPGTAGQDAAVSRPRRGPRGQVVIFANWCKGCGLCVEFCPMKVLSFNDDGQVVVAPDTCTACHWCDTHCPDFAIVVERIV